MKNLLLQAELVHKAGPHTSWVQFCTVYPPQDVREAVLAAGWEGEKHPATPIDVRFLGPGEPTEAFCQPPGTGIFGIPDEATGKAAIARLRKALKPFGITLGRARRQTFQEAI